MDGKVKRITKNGGNQIIEFTYDGLGNRISKTILPDNITTVYSRDAQGNVMAVCETNEANITNITSNKTVTLMEHHIYGSSKLGIEEKVIPLEDDGSNVVVQNNIVLTTNNITDARQYHAINNIEVAGDANTFIVGPTGNLTLKAGNEILIKPGFNATLGAVFSASIEPYVAPLPEDMFARVVGLSSEISNAPLLPLKSTPGPSTRVSPKL